MGHPAVGRAASIPAAGSTMCTRARSRPMLGAPGPRAASSRWSSRSRARLLYFSVGSGFLPRADEGGFVVDYLTPAGTALEETDRQLKKVEEVLLKTPEVAAIQRRTGSELGLFATQQNSGDVLVRLKPRDQRRSRRPKKSSPISATSWPKPRRAWRSSSCSCCRTCWAISKGNPTPIEVKVFGDDATVLAELGEQIEEMLGKIEGLVDIVGVQSGNPESHLADRSGCRRPPRADGGRRLSSSSARPGWARSRPITWRSIASIPVRVRYPDAIRFNHGTPGRDDRSRRRGQDRAAVGAGDRGARDAGQTVLMRENLRQMALVSGRLEDRDLGSAVAEITAKLAATSSCRSATRGRSAGSTCRSVRRSASCSRCSRSRRRWCSSILVVQFRAFSPPC